MKRFTLLVLLGACSSLAANAQTVEDRAKAAAAAAHSKTGLSDALRQNFVTPGMSGQSVATICPPSAPMAQI